MIAIENVTIHAGAFRLEGASLSVPAGQYGVLMGRTGSGKTTLLESVIGLRRVDSGSILLGGEDVTQKNPAVRGVGYVPQDGALFRQMPVEEHLAFALLIRRADKRAIKARVEQLAEMLQITHLLKRKPQGLSGGERQRVALGRALSFNPRVLCLDEPLSALDSETRREMCTLLTDVRQRTGVTALHVTHNLDEAQTLADCLFRIENGSIQHIDHTNVASLSTPADPQPS